MADLSTGRAKGNVPQDPDLGEVFVKIKPNPNLINKSNPGLPQKPRVVPDNNIPSRLAPQQNIYTEGIRKEIAKYNGDIEPNIIKEMTNAILKGPAAIAFSAARILGRGWGAYGVGCDYASKVTGIGNTVSQVGYLAVASGILATGTVIPFAATIGIFGPQALIPAACLGVAIALYAGTKAVKGFLAGLRIGKLEKDLLPHQIKVY